jgi:hypothetical protein
MPSTCSIVSWASLPDAGPPATAMRPTAMPAASSGASCQSAPGPAVPARLSGSSVPRRATDSAQACTGTSLTRNSVTCRPIVSSSIVPASSRVTSCNRRSRVSCSDILRCRRPFSIARAIR